MLKEFRAFILKGNLVEIAVAFIMAVVFAALAMLVYIWWRSANRTSAT